ncbi:MAG: DUF2793 domain-containing protein [Pseudomonadota bacterium]
MAETANLDLALLDAAQAQKHVTMNEALTRIDDLLFGAVASVGQTAPPVPVDGEAHVVGAPATGDWSGHENQIAYAANGGWRFLTPRPGWRVWSLSDHHDLFCDSVEWRPGVSACSAGAAVTTQGVLEFDHVLATGGASTSVETIPDKAIVLGISARVIEAITGASTWSLGVPGSPDRYGSGFGTALNSLAEGVTGQPIAYYGGVPVEVTAAGGSFTGGTLRIAVHFQAITAPRAV